MMSDTPAPGTSQVVNADAATPQLEITPEARTAAYGVIARLRSDEKFRMDFLRQDPETKATVEAAHRAIHTQTVTVRGRPAEEVATMVGSVLKHAELNPAIVKQIYEGTEISQQEYDFARARKQQMFSDRGWCARYIDGDRACRSELLAVNILLTSKVAAKPK
jgi:hypothetical protein